MIELNALLMPWAFMMTYDHHQQTMHIQCSQTFLDVYELNNEHLRLNHDEIISHVHKYDQRKLSYFTSIVINSTFDTLLRIRLTNDGQYLRTIAVCNQTDTGFSCLHILEKEVLWIKKTAQYSPTFAQYVKLEMIDGDWIQSMHLTQHITQFRAYIPQLISRT